MIIQKEILICVLNNRNEERKLLWSKDDIDKIVDSYKEYSVPIISLDRKNMLEYIGNFVKNAERSRKNYLKYTPDGNRLIRENFLYSAPDWWKNYRNDSRRLGELRRRCKNDAS